MLYSNVINTDPAGLGVVVTYNGSSIPPTDAGVYAVVATVDDPDYVGSATGTMSITEVVPTAVPSVGIIGLAILLVSLLILGSQKEQQTRYRGSANPEQ